MNPRSDGTYRHYAAVIDKIVVLLIARTKEKAQKPKKRKKTTQRAVQKDTVKTATNRKQTDLSDYESIDESQKKKELYRSETDYVDDDSRSSHVVKTSKSKQTRSAPSDDEFMDYAPVERSYKDVND